MRDVGTVYAIVRMGCQLAAESVDFPKLRRRARLAVGIAVTVLADSRDLARIQKAERPKLPAVRSFVEFEVERYERERGEDDPETVFARHHLAQLRARTGDLDGAVEELRRILASRRRTLPPHDPRIRDAEHELAGMQQRAAPRPRPGGRRR